MRDNRLTRGLTAEEKKTVMNIILREQVTLAAGDVLAPEGMIMDRFFIVESGGIVAARSRYNGSVSLIVLFHQDDIVGLDVINSASRKNPHDLVATTEAEVLALDFDAVYDNRITDATRQKLIKNIMLELANESIRKLYKIDVLYRKSLRARIAVFLCHMHEMSEAGDFDIGMDREAFSQYLGVNRSALSHELSLMRQEGLINMRRSKFHVLDIEALTAFTF
jgi:CRP-like cAMP-binding protein